MSVFRRSFVLLLGIGLLPLTALAAAPSNADADASKAGNPERYWATPHTVTTQGEVTIAGQHIRYSADAATLILRNKDGKPTGEMFYVAYFKSGGDASRRPIAFLYNGGPGGSSSPLHIGAFGPVRVVTESHTHTAPAPYQLVNNQYSLLDASDLVFVDAMGTGFSRILCGPGEPQSRHQSALRAGAADLRGRRLVSRGAATAARCAASVAG